MVYHIIQHAKRGWIARNRVLQHGSANILSIPLAKGPDKLGAVEIEIAHDFDRAKLFRAFSGSYLKASHYKEVLRWVEEIFLFED